MANSTENYLSNNEKTIEEIKSELKSVSQRLNKIESILSEILPQLQEFSRSAKILQRGFKFYESVLGAIEKLRSVAYIEDEYPELKSDPISLEIIKSLEQYGALNISQLTRYVRMARGTASRRIIRERIKKLISMGIIEIAYEDEKAKYYRLAV